MTLLIGVTDIFYCVVVHLVCSFNDNAMESYHLDNLLPYHHQVPRYDAITLAQNLVKKGSIRTGNIHQFNWAGLGFQVGVCFSSLPSNCSFLYGPLDAEYTPKERKKAERKKRAQEADEEMENLEETRPESKDQQGGKKAGDGDGNELSAVEQHIRTINKTLMNRAKVEYKSAKEQVGSYLTQLKQEGVTDESELSKKQKNYLREARKVGAVNCLFNPKSFTQTVENIFHFSFSVKTGKAEIKARGLKEAEEYGLEPGPVAINKDQEAAKPMPKQAIVSLNMKVSFLFALWYHICNYHTFKCALSLTFS